jgi:hypothetical protein
MLFLLFSKLKLMYVTFLAERKSQPPPWYISGTMARVMICLFVCFNASRQGRARDLFSRPTPRLHN